VYAAGLYLAAKANSTEAVLAAAGPKRMHVVMLREIDGNELGRLFTRGMQDNATKEEFAKTIPGTITMGEIFSGPKKKLLPGESLTIDWVPGVGTNLLVNGALLSQPVKEPEFFTAMMRIWLGRSPADSQLKDALLGKAAPAGPANN
jgi:Chalcone isomerase-like